jgi:hypothetical protein
MKRTLAVILALALILALAPMAAGLIEYKSLDELQEDGVYTYEDMLAIYDLGYRDGVRDSNGGGAGTVTRSGSEEKDSFVSFSGAGGVTYVVNTNTGKFHYPNCKSVGKIKDKNRMDFTGTRAELIGEGYEPCGSCKP